MARLDEIVAKSKWRAADAAEVLQAWRDSGGGSLAAFARGLGVGAERVRRWRCKLDDRALAETPVAFVELRPRAAARDAGVEVVVGERLVRVRATFDAATLVRVVRTLEALGC